MKRFITMLLCAVMLLGLCACAPADTNNATDAAETTAATTEKEFLAGYGMVDITPDFQVLLAGMGEKDRFSDAGVLNKMYSIAVALTDTEGNTAIIISNDLISTKDSDYNFIVEWCKTEYGIPKENIIYSCNHQHSVPSYDDNSDYQKFVLPLIQQAVREAMEDRAPAQMYINSVETNALAFVRHYWNREGEMFGNNYGTKGSGLVSHESDADNMMHLVKFDRGEDKKPILVTNFRGHPMMSLKLSYRAISSDWIGCFREEVTKELGYNVIYMNGAGGNVSAQSEIAEENKSADMREHGKRAASFVKKAEDSYTKVETGLIKFCQVKNTYNTDHSMDHLYERALPIAEMYAKDLQKAKDMLKNYPEFNSVYHANNVVKKANRDTTMDLPLTVISLGDVAFTSHAYEMFDTNGMELQAGTVGNENYAVEDQLENPYKLTIICCLSNGHNGYLPSALNCKNGGYSVDITYFEHGTAEKLVTDYLTILNDLHG